MLEMVEGGLDLVKNGLAEWREARLDCPAQGPVAGTYSVTRLGYRERWCACACALSVEYRYIYLSTGISRLARVGRWHGSRSRPGAGQ